MENAQLIQRCLAGDQAGIQEFVEAHQRAVYRLALSLLDDPQEAEDAAQEVLTGALSALEGFRGRASLSTWLYRITVNHCQNRLRKRRARERLQDRLQALWRLGRSVQPEQQLVQQETGEIVWQAVQRLNDRHRLPVILFYYHDCPVAEIAAILEINTGTVLSRLHTARERLRADLRGSLQLAEKDEKD